MSLITLFTAPKPFIDPHISTIQFNAINSWKHLPEVDVLLLGDETGLAETAVNLGVRHIPDIQCNLNGTPLISSMFATARQNSDSPLLCIINTDILLMSDFVEAARQVLAFTEKFVLLGRRWDMDVKEALDFPKNWSQQLKKRALINGELHRPAGSDYFLFPRDCYNDVPDFAIGRAGWDNWMIYKARQEKWPAIDGTDSIMIIHQNHDYSHLPGGQPHYTLPETDDNIRLAGGQAAIRYTILDTDARLINGRLRCPAPSWGRLWRAVELLLRKVFFFLPDERREKVVRPKRWFKMFRKLFK
ncbi:MAG: hypothetical protein JXA13_11895 [Anaerolineales bacterium]|nr:hypothetical protein [Anaerolineales bacterium]